MLKCEHNKGENMKITNKDICKQLKEMDGQDWQFGFGFFLIPHPCFYVKGKSVNDVCHEYRTQIPLTIRYNSPIDEEKIEELFENLDWSEVYKNSIIEYIPSDGYRKVFKHNADKNGFNLVLDSFRLEGAVNRAFESAVKQQTSANKQKTDEGRGGK